VAASWAGYNNILLYKSGYPEWLRLGLPMDKGAPAVKALEKK